MAVGGFRGVVAAAEERSSRDALVLKTRKRETEKLLDCMSTPMTKKKAKIVPVALANGDPSYVSVINNMTEPNVLSEDLLHYWMEQADQELEK